MLVRIEVLQDHGALTQAPKEEGTWKAELGKPGGVGRTTGKGTKDKATGRLKND